MIFMPFPRFVAPISDPPPLAMTNVASMKHSSSFSAPLSRSSLATSVSTRRKTSSRQQVPLRPCVENPQHRFEHTTGRNRFAPRTSIGNFLLRKMIPDALPLLVPEPNHSTLLSDRQQSAILR